MREAFPAAHTFRGLRGRKVSQRDSGYERKERDLYETPAWVTRALMPHVPERIKTVWEPAKGGGKMWAALCDARRFNEVYGTDLDSGHDFLEQKDCGFDAIITNPPYVHARKFIDKALDLTSRGGFVAMLLRTDYDHAATRLDLFQLAPFAKKVVLTKRIKWFEGSKGQPSFNHAWFIWDWTHDGPPTLAYGPLVSQNGGGVD